MPLQEDQNLTMKLFRVLPFIFCALVFLNFFIGIAGLWLPAFLLTCFLCFFIAVTSVVAFWFVEMRSLFKNVRFFEILIFTVFVFTLLTFGVSVLTPETGFDALWYHLPIINDYADDGALTYQPQRYQSLYPQYGDIFLLFGYSVFWTSGTKIIAYGFFILLIYSVFRWLRATMTVGDSLLGVLVVCYFQVVSWQASSAYVDIISSVFFLWSVFFLLDCAKNDQKHVSLVCSALSAGVFLGTKFINLGFIPVLALVTCILLVLKNKEANTSKIQKVFIWLGIVILFALPWYLRAWWYTGNILYPMGTVYADPVIQQMGVTGWSEWLSFRVNALWKLPIEFFLKNDGYTTPLLFIFAPAFFIKRKLTLENVLLLAIGIYGLLFWFFFPPPSTRYVLGPIIILWIVTYQHIWSGKYKEQNRQYLRYLIFITVIPFLLIRVFVTTRSIPFLVGWETQDQYLQRFRNGFLDEKIDGYYYDRQ